MRPRRKPHYDVWSYFAQKEKEFEELSLAPDRPVPQLFGEERGSNGQRGRIFGNLFLTDWAFLTVSELVIVEDDHVHRLEYAYFLIVDGEEVWGYERDPSHDPPVHRHSGPDHVRDDAEPVAFKDVVEEAWEVVSSAGRL
jgi:hypothetical protein